MNVTSILIRLNDDINIIFYSRYDAIFIIDYYQIDVIFIIIIKYKGGKQVIGMNYWDKKLIREQLDRKLNKLKPILNMPVPKGGWVKTIRVALGMSTYDLAKKTDLDQSRISRIESSEAKQEIKLSTLQKVAEGLGVKFVYGFVPEQDLEEIVRQQAMKIAKKRLNRIDHSMKLELQGVSSEEQEEALNDLIDKILVEEPKNFWND